MSIKDRIVKTLRRLPVDRTGKYSYPIDSYYWFKANFLCSLVSVKRGGLEFELYLPEGGYADYVRRRDLYEPGLTDELIDVLEPDTVFWNVGAYCGIFTILANQLVNDPSDIHSFEPYYVNRILERNVNEFAPGSRLIKKGLSDKKSDTFLEMITGDDYVEANESPDVVKMDIEGDEFRALKGMESTLESASLTLLCEVHPTLMDQSTEEFLNWLRNHGYGLQYVKNFRTMEYTIEDSFDVAELPTEPFLIRAE